MADLYNTVKKQGEQIDDLQKNVSNHTTRIETLETQAKAIPPPTEPTLPKEIKVELPPDIATNSRIGRMLDEKLAKISGDENLKNLLEQMPDSMAKGVANVITNNLGVKVKDVMKDGIRHEFADERRELRDIISDLRYRVQNMINGQWWLAIPKWVYILFCVLFLAAGGFGYGFFYLLDQNGRLREIEWLYRRERTLYRTEKDRQLLINHEKDFFTGTPQEQDSIKDLIRYWEHKGGYDKTFLYFAPTED